MSRLAVLVTAPRASAKSTRVDKTIGRHTISRLNPLFRSNASLVELLHETSRSMRPGEENGKEHFFVDGGSQEERKDIIRARQTKGDYLYVVEYKGDLYGLMLQELEKLQNGIGIIPFGVENILECSNFIRNYGVDVVTVGIIPPTIEQQKILFGNRGDEGIEKHIEENLRSVELFDSIKGRFDYLIESIDRKVHSRYNVRLPNVPIQDAKKYPSVIASINHRQSEPLHRIVLLEIERMGSKFSKDVFYAEQFSRKVFGRELMDLRIGMGVNYNQDDIASVAERLECDPFTIKSVLDAKKLSKVEIDSNKYVFTFAGVDTPARSTFETEIVNRYIEMVFGSYAEGKLELTYRLSVRDNDPKIIVRHLPAPNSLDAFGEEVKPEIELLFERYVKQIDGKRNDVPISEDDLERIVKLSESIVMKQIERKVKPLFLFEQDMHKRIRGGMFPFTADLNEEGYTFHQPHFAISGVGINFLYQCFLLTGDRDYLEEANEGIKHIERARKDISKFNLSFILGQLVQFASDEKGDIAKKFIQNNIESVLQCYDSRLGFFQNKLGSDVINAYLYTLPRLLRFAMSEGVIGNEWEERLQKHIETYKRVLIREDGSVAEQAEYANDKWVFSSINGYDPENKGDSHLSRLQSMCLEMMLDIGDIDTAEKISKYVESVITDDYDVSVDENYPRVGHWEDNAAKINLVNQYNRLYQKTGNEKYRDLSTKLMLNILFEEISFEEHRDGLVKGVFYDVKGKKGINCSFMYADESLLKMIKRDK